MYLLHKNFVQKLFTKLCYIMLERKWTILIISCGGRVTSLLIWYINSVISSHVTNNTKEKVTCN